MKQFVGRVARKEHSFGVATAHLRPVRHLIERRMGLADLVGGTLNVELPEDYVVSAEQIITPSEYGFDETLKLRRCLVNGHKGVIMRPDTHETRENCGHGKNHLEIMGRARFRDVLLLQDGDPVNVEVEGDDDWWDRGI